MNWYYYDGQKPVEPLSAEAMKQLRNCGMLDAETPIAPEVTENLQAFDLAIENVPDTPSPPPRPEETRWPNWPPGLTRWQGWMSLKAGAVFERFSKMSSRGTYPFASLESL